MKKFIILLPVGFLLMVLQAIWKMLAPWTGPAPDFLLIMLIYVGISFSLFYGMIFGFGLGIFGDAFWGLQPGLFPVINTLVIIISRFSGKRFYLRSYPFQVIIVILMTGLANLLEFIVLAAIDNTRTTGAALWALTWRQMIWNGLLAIPTSMLLEKLESSITESNTELVIDHFGDW